MLFGGLLDGLTETVKRNKIKKHSKKAIADLETIKKSFTAADGSKEGDISKKAWHKIGFDAILSTKHTAIQLLLKSIVSDEKLYKAVLKKLKDAPEDFTKIYK